MGSAYQEQQPVALYFPFSSSISLQSLDFMARCCCWVLVCCMYVYQPHYIGQWKWMAQRNRQKPPPNARIAPIQQPPIWRYCLRTTQMPNDILSICLWKNRRTDWTISIIQISLVNALIYLHFCRNFLFLRSPKFPILKKIIGPLAFQYIDGGSGFELEWIQSSPMKWMQI